VPFTNPPESELLRADNLPEDALQNNFKIGVDTGVSGQYIPKK
jgi:hypothetical protein